MKNAFSLFLFALAPILGIPSVFAQSSASAPIIFTVAGGTFGDGGMATGIGIGQVESIALDKNGNLYLADSNNFLVRKVDTNGILTTVAGNGIPLGPQDIVSYAPYFLSVDIKAYFDYYDFGNIVIGNPTDTGDGGPATSASLAFPSQIITDSTGNLYILDANPYNFDTNTPDTNTRIRKVSTNGVINTVAGNGTAGFSGDGGLAVSAEIDTDNFRIDRAGNLYFTNGYYDTSTDTLDVRIRKVAANGIITTIAGNGTEGFSGDGGLATSAEISPSSNLALDAGGNLYFADGLTRIRKVGTNGIITTVAGNGNYGDSGDGGPATNAAITPNGDVVLDKAGNLYFVDHSVYIRKVGTNGIITTVAGNGNYGDSGDGGPATNAAITPFSGDIVLDGEGNIYFVDLYSSRIREVGINGIITTVAGNGNNGDSGDGGPATNAEINDDNGILIFDSSGNLFFLNHDPGGYRIRRVDTNGVIGTVAGNGSEGYNGDGSPATSKEVDGPAGITVDGSGNLYIADFNNHWIVKADISGMVSTVAGGSSSCFSSFDCAQDGSPATSAQINTPLSVTVDGSGNFYFVDVYKVRKVNTNGILTTVAGNGSNFDLACGSLLGDGGPAISACLSEPQGLTVDSLGNLYIGDTNDFRVRKVDTQGVITTVAGNGTAGYTGDGGPATSAEIGHPEGIGVDSAGNLYIGDGDNFRVRKVDTKGVITTVAGAGTTGFSGDGGLATSAQISGVNGLAVDKTGNLYIADPFNNRVRRVDPNGVITTYVGNGSIGFSGDGGPATDAMLTFPGGLAVDSSGTLYVGDVFNYRVREVAAAFTLSLNPTAITIASPGEPGTTSIAVTPAARFTGNVSLMCTVAFVGTGSATKPPTCSLSSTMLSISGPGNVVSTLTVNTTPTLTPVALAVIGFLFIPCCKRRRALVFCLALLCLVVTCVPPIGCGGSSGVETGSIIPGTTPGNYSVTITATSGGFSSSIIVPVTVK